MEIRSSEETMVSNIEFDWLEDNDEPPPVKFLETKILNNFMKPAIQGPKIKLM